MSPDAASSPPDPADARRKIAAYLRAAGLGSAAADQAAAALLDTALRDAGPAALSSRDAVERALDVLDRWPATLARESPGATPARVRARLFLADGAARWPGALARGELPAELRAAVAAASLQPAPELLQATMTPQPLDLGPVSEVADETWRTFDKWPLLRGVSMWALFALLLCAVFYTVRF